MGFFEGFDHYTITRPLTFVSWDDYVGTGHLNPAENGVGARFDARIEAREFLGAGDAAGRGELGGSE